jgi:hypothetical protein
MPSSKAPVLLISFNRPHLSGRVFERIRGYRPDRLYLAVDGPRDPSAHPRDATATAACRELAAHVDWPCEVFTRFSQANQGCGRGVSNAITWMFERENCGIILEDDCVPEPTFFVYCAELLERYQDHPEVMHVSGNNFAGKGTAEACAPYSYAFTRYADLWGWGTWARAWKHFRYEIPPPEEVPKSAFIMEGVDRYRQCAQRDRVLSTRQNSSMWGYQWQYAVLKQRGLCAAPAVNQISNTGFGEEATHTTGAKDSPASNAPTMPLAFPLCHPPSIIVSPDLNRIYADNVLGSTARYRKRYLKRWIRTLLIPGYQPEK